MEAAFLLAIYCRCGRQNAILSSVSTVIFAFSSCSTRSLHKLDCQVSSECAYISSFVFPLIYVCQIVYTVEWTEQSSRDVLTPHNLGALECLRQYFHHFNWLFVHWNAFESTACKWIGFDHLRITDHYNTRVVDLSKWKPQNFTNQMIIIIKVILFQCCLN